MIHRTYNDENSQEKKNNSPYWENNFLQNFLVFLFWNFKLNWNSNHQRKATVYYVSTVKTTHTWPRLRRVYRSMDATQLKQNIFASAQSSASYMYFAKYLNKYNAHFTNYIQWKAINPSTKKNLAVGVAVWKGLFNKKIIDWAFPRSKESPSNKVVEGRGSPMLNFNYGGFLHLRFKNKLNKSLLILKTIITQSCNWRTVGMFPNQTFMCCARGDRR